MIKDELVQIEYNYENNVLHFDKEFLLQLFPIQRKYLKKRK
jgi:hypothetical protein